MLSLRQFAYISGTDEATETSYEDHKNISECLINKDLEQLLNNWKVTSSIGQSVVIKKQTSFQKDRYECLHYGWW